jgi:hypothetical protein
MRVEDTRLTCGQDKRRYRDGAAQTGGTRRVATSP